MNSDTVSGPRLRFFPRPSSAGEALWQPLASRSELERTSYFIVKNEDEEFKETKKPYKLITGDFEDGGHGNPDLIVGIHLQSSGSVFIESLHPTQEVYLARDLSRLVKCLLPRSKPPMERMLVLLDSDATITINGEEINFQIGSLENATPIDVEGDVAMAEESEEPQVLVQQSHPQDTLRRGESDLVQSTPAIPDTIQDEPRVHETPSVESRFLNPDSATVTLPRNLPREDTFGRGNLPTTPSRNKSVAKPFVTSTASNGLNFGGQSSGRPGEVATQLLAMDDANLSTSDEEEGEPLQSSKFFKQTASAKKTVFSIDLTGSMSENEILASAKGITPVVNMTQDVSSVKSSEVIEDEEENRGSQAESMRRQFSESAMITSFTSVVSGGVSRETSPIVEGQEEEQEGQGKPFDRADTPVSHIKRHGVPEGFLYEEHKKDTTPKQTYGKGRRRSGPRPASKGKRTSAGTVSSDHNNEDEAIEDMKVAKTNKRKGKAAKSINDTDESEEEEASPRRSRRKITAEEEEDTVIETAEDEDEVLPPPRTQGRRGRRTVQSQADSSAGTTGDTAEEEGPTNKANVTSPNEAEKVLKGKEPDIAGEEAELASTAKSIVKPTRGRRGTKNLSDVSGTIFSTAPEAVPTVVPKVAPGTKTARATRKRRRVSGDIEEDSEEQDCSTTREGTVESTIQVSEQPKPKRAKAASTKKPISKRGNKQDVTPPPPQSGQNEKVFGDTQYTFPDATQTQSLDRVEARTPRTAKKKTVTPQKRVGATAPTKRKKADSRLQQTDEEVEAENDEHEETNGGKTRTRDRYEGDSPKIVFSNSGLDGKKDIEKFLRANGGKKMQNVSAPGVNFLVVGPGELKRTPKLTVGVALGKYVVEDQWLIDSKEIGYFLDPDLYIPNDPTHEKAWNFSLQAAIDRGRKGENCVLKDHNVYITSSLLSQLKQSGQEESLVEMLKAAGAGTVTKKAPKGKQEDDEHALILGTEKSDSDVPALEKAGWTVYGTGIVAISVLRGKLEGGDEFRISTEAGGKEVSQKAGRGRKGK